MKALVALSAAAALLIPTASFAAQMCPDRTPAAITSVSEDSIKCQKTIAKELSKYAKTRLKELNKCRLKEPTGTCPTVKNTEKMEKAALKVRDKITKQCADDAVQAGLTSSYAGETDDTIISSCGLSQYFVDAEVAVGHFTGMATEDPFQDADPKQRAKCVKEVSKLGEKYVLGQLKTVSKCIDKAMKDQVAGDLSALCVGEYSAGVFMPPTDVKTAEKLIKLNDKTEEKVAKKCDLEGALPDDGFIQTIFACYGAETVADLQNCLLCNGWDSMLSLLEAAYAEDHAAVVSAGTNTITDAVIAASAGDKIFIQGGTYDEEPTYPDPNDPGSGVDMPVGKDDLSLIGCGAATNNRPFLPAADGTYDRGINANSTDGLTFQSLRFEDWDNDAVRVALANGVSFRDIVDDGMINTRYAVFPIESTGILVEACKVAREDDAPIYIGQSDGGVVRFNDIREGVAAIEFENSGNLIGHNNYITHNTAGVLVFKDPTLPVQLSNDHVVMHNVIENLDVDNFGTGFVGIIPRGTGILIVTVDDALYQGNIIRDNDLLGVATIDQDAANLLAFLASEPAPFPVQSANEDSNNNLVRRNYIANNGGDPQTGFEIVAADQVLAILNDAGGAHENCFEDNPGVVPSGFDPNDPLNLVAEVAGENDCD